ncbi:hypothetical protein CU097_008074 [Rhizopus azygosporus]|uniref:Uncharacterized protein n=1 Tax=Rhizopus azygosporus TaxID=86630 RepID=A0A367JMP6_RHIAZ|nr:hypothetical protein CU097_008074 [Rhizopus azygosporus]
MLANRFNIVLPSLINPYQTGFIPNWLISNNGQLNQVLMVNLKHASPQSPYVAIFLDHKKAYDCVRPGHLSHILFQFGFPSSLVSCLSPLLFNMRILISTNGRRPLTGVLLHPISLQFMQKPSPLPGIQMATASNPTNFVSQTYKQPLHPVKLLSYADNLKVFLSHPGEWLILLHILDTYGKASNARLPTESARFISQKDRHRGQSLAVKVVLAPKQWLQEIRMIVRTFVVPSKPAPSWPTLCRKKKHCGISLVDVEDQNMALYMLSLIF